MPFFSVSTESRCLTTQTGEYIGTVHPATSAEAVKMVLNAEVGELDGSGGWEWVKLANGDIALVIFPWGDTYEEVRKLEGI